MNQVFTALVPALHVPWGYWWDSGSGGSYAGNGGGNYGSGGGSWS